MRPIPEEPLRLFELFRRRPPVRDARALADFIDRQAAFLVQKGIYEYSRARAGHYAKVLFAESGFQNAVERSRWRAYPLGLAMVAELVEGVLRPYGADRNVQLDEPWAETYFNLMPIHEKLRGRDFPTTRNYLRVTLCNIHDEFTKGSRS